MGRTTTASTLERGAKRDHLDDQLDVWTREIPTLDRLTEGIVERINKLSRKFARSMEETLTQYGLARRTYNVLGRLRYEGPPYRLSAGELATDMMLSSGAMTNRLDRLEQAGMVRRLRDPNDRRGVLVEPTEAGHAAWDGAVAAQAKREELIASVLTDEEKVQLYDLLRTLMGAFPADMHHGKGKEEVHTDDEDDAGD